jgi:uncharacterized protein (DUF1778 family)
MSGIRNAKERVTVHGRPPRAGKTSKYQLQLRMTEEERAEVQRLAAKYADGSLSDFIRMAAFMGGIKAREWDEVLQARKAARVAERDAARKARA